LLLLQMMLLALAMLLAAQAADPSFLFILGDDIGWADFSYNNGTANSPRIKEWTESDGTTTFMDFHTGGTVCSPTRATVLTGRNHFRDCVDYVYGCSDMTECVPHFNFAPERTFTIGDAARAANKNYTSHFGGKWVSTRRKHARLILMRIRTPPTSPPQAFGVLLQ
jgi:arylsulfatase A-like enzyme